MKRELILGLGILLILIGVIAMAIFYSSIQKQYDAMRADLSLDGNKLAMRLELYDYEWRKFYVSVGAFVLGVLMVIIQRFVGRRD